MAPRIISRQSQWFEMMPVGDIASAATGNPGLGQELAFLDDHHVEVGSQGLGPYGRVNPGGATSHHHQRLLVLLLAGVVGVRRGANWGGGGGAASPAEDGGGGAASGRGGGGGGVEPRQLRHFVDELGGGSGVSRAARTRAIPWDWIVG